MTLDILGQDIRYTLRTLGRDRGFTSVAVLDSRARHRRQHRRVQRGEHDSAAAASVSQRAATGVDCAAADEVRSVLRDVFDRCVRRVSREYALLSGRDRLLRVLQPGQSEAGAQWRRAHPGHQHRRDRATSFQVLGVQPAMGRAFTADDGRHGAAPVVLLSDAWWRRQFNADPDIVGKAIDLNGKQTTVIGVLPRTFDFGAVFSPGTKVDAITPLDLYGPPRDWGNIITMIGRMKPGVTLGQAVGDAKAAEKYMCWNNRYPQRLRQGLQGCGCPRAAEGLRQRQAAALAGGAVVGGRRHSADRLREPVQSAAGARRGAQQGVRDARSARRRPAAASCANCSPRA